MSNCLQDPITAAAVARSTLPTPMIDFAGVKVETAPAQPVIRLETCWRRHLPVGSMAAAKGMFNGLQI